MKERTSLWQRRFTRRQFLARSAGVGAGLVAIACGVESEDDRKRQASPTVRSTIKLERTPTVETEKWPPGKLLVFTQPEVKYGYDYLEQNLDLVEESEVVLVNTDGNEPKGVATNLISLPVWSPSGEKFAVQRYERKATMDDGMLMVIDKNGELLLRMGIGACPASLSWSPDEQSIIFSSRFYNSRFKRPFGWPPDSAFWIDGIRLFDINDRSNTKLIPSSGGEFDRDPVISPNGSRFVFVSYQYSSQFRVIVAPLKSYKYEDRTVLNPEMQTIDHGNIKAANASIRFQWTPDGEKIVYMLEKKTTGNSLCIVDVSEPKPQLLEIVLDCPSSIDKGPFTFSDGSIEHPVKWNYFTLDSMDLSADGKQIVVGCPGSLFLTDINGKNKKTVKLPDTFLNPINNVRWLSDNKRIAFVHQDRYYYINSDGSGLTEVPFTFLKRNPNEQIPLGVLISSEN
jgi:Tol biopolymer transport system component